MGPGIRQGGVSSDRGGPEEGWQFLTATGRILPKPSEHADIAGFGGKRHGIASEARNPRIARGQGAVDDAASLGPPVI